MAIRIPCGALRRPTPLGSERKRIATSGVALLAMTAKLEGLYFYVYFPLIQTVALFIVSRETFIFRRRRIR